MNRGENLFQLCHGEETKAKQSYANGPKNRCKDSANRMQRASLYAEAQPVLAKQSSLIAMQKYEK
jgi:hypothetical protein